MTDLDRRVAALRGWEIVTVNYYGEPDETSEQVRYRAELDQAKIASIGVYARRGPGDFVPLNAPFEENCYSPSTNLQQAMELWDEERPEGWWLEVAQTNKGKWYVNREGEDFTHGTKCTGLPDIPCAITQAWIEAKEAS